MALRLVTAALAVLVSLPALAQQPVYPSFPPPPAPSGDTAPHPSGDAQQPPQQGDYPYQDPADDPGQASPTAPQKPSPYPQQEPYPQQPAQQQPSYPQSAPPPAPPVNAPPGGYAPAPPTSWLNWIPRGMEALSRTAAFHTDLTFDRTMLQLASGMWDGPVDPATASAINRLDGISVHVYHYAAPGMYDPRLLEGLRREYSALGWQHLVGTHSATREGATDLWISFHHLQATGAVLLFQTASNVNLIAFSGNLSPLDLLHLRGHFGIPRFAGDRFVPAPGARARTAPPPPPRD